MRRTVLLALWWAVSCLADQNNAFQQGSSLGTAASQGALSGITTGAAAGAVPAYGTNPPEVGFYQGGQGLVSAPGTAKVTGCSSAAPDPDPIKRQECEAVNFLARNPNVRPQITITQNDPMILTARANQNNAETFFQSLGLSGGTGNTTQCTTSTQTTPAQYTTQTCSVLKEVGTQQCSMGRVVNIDADANYQCDKTVTAFTSQQRQPTVSTSSCSYGRQVNIDTDANFQCDQTVKAYVPHACNKIANVTVTQTGGGLNVSPGQILFSANNPQGFYNRVTAGASDGVVTIYNAKGYCSGSVTVTVPTTVRVYNYSSATGGACGCSADYIHSISCSGTICTDYSYSACYPALNWSFSFTRPTINIVITKTVRWDDQCIPYE